MYIIKDMFPNISLLPIFWKLYTVKTALKSYFSKIASSPDTLSPHYDDGTASDMAVGKSAQPLYQWNERKAGTQQRSRLHYNDYHLNINKIFVL